MLEKTPPATGSSQWLGRAHLISILMAREPRLLCCQVVAREPPLGQVSQVRP